MQTNQKYKMLVTDMDYTLLNKHKQVSEKNKEAIKKAKDKGVIIVVATGRLYTSALYYAKLLGIEAPIIASNGAIIREAHTNKTLYQNIISDEAALRMIELCKETGLYCHLYTMDAIYAEKLVNISYRYTEWNAMLPKEDQIKIEIVPSLEGILEKEKGNVLKAVVIDEEGDKLSYVRSEILKTGLVTASQSLKDNLEVMNYGVSKGNAIQILGELYGIKREEIIAIGDNENDLSMIEYAGLGVAMDNAVQAAKEAADYITGDYNHDGVAQVIEKFIL